MLQNVFSVGMFQSNCYLVVCEATEEAVLIDPGDESARILAAIRQHHCNVRWLLLTHAHLDHIMAVGDVKAATGAPVLLHKADLPLYESLPEQSRAFQFTANPPPPVDGTLHDGQEITFGRHTLKVLHTPGHSPGGCCLQLQEEDRRVYSGDVLFRESIGRTDLWEGDYHLLLHSIQTHLLNLPDDIPVYPGHGPATTIGHERRFNPFLGGTSE